MAIALNPIKEYSLNRLEEKEKRECLHIEHHLVYLKPNTPHYYQKNKKDSPSYFLNFSLTRDVQVIIFIVESHEE